MRILGIGDHVNCGSALIEDGRVISAINDERLVREKMVFGVPRKSVAKHLELNDLAPEDVDAIAIGTHNQHLIGDYTDYREGWFGLDRGWFKQTVFDVASYVCKLHGALPLLESGYYALRTPAFMRRRKALRRIFREEFGFECPIEFVDHHYCHATSAYYTSEFDRATVFTIDGGGDGKSAKVYRVEDGDFTELCSVSAFNSLGNFYSYITQICGYKAGRHEGKITGLAAYGEPRYVSELREIYQFKDGKFENVGKVFFHSAVEEIERRLPEGFRHKDLAASIQKYTEEMVTDFVDYWLRETGHQKVAIAGGLFGNVKINQRIHELDRVEEIYVHPGMSDAGLPVGAALAKHFDETPTAVYPPESKPMPHVYLGPEYGDAEIQKRLESDEVEAEYVDDIEVRVAELLADGAVVARFNGRMEYGPRALGNRTILYQPTDPSAQYWLNQGLDRTEFMPFAPVVLDGFVDQCFENWEGARDTARFMTITFDCTEWMSDRCPGVVHIDQTARPQIVSEDDNPSMYRILSAYYELTGLPALINTSLNLHEEPIVCTPADAIRAFEMSNLDYLAMGNWLAENPTPLSRETDRREHRAALNRRGAVESVV